MENINVLLVEDEIILASIIKESLEKRGFSITIAQNGVDGWSRFRSSPPDICIIDVMMPRKDGFSLVSEIRMIDEQVPIIFLTARAQTEDVLKGLELGADDYMKKPFSMEELILRLKAMVRRRTVQDPNLSVPDFQIGEFHFRHHRLKLLRGSDTADLSQREADLLLMLLQHKDRVLERKLALIKLWGEETPFTARSMDVYITRLRKFFKADPSIEIINIRGIGYSLVETPKK